MLVTRAPAGKGFLRWRQPAEAGEIGYDVIVVGLGGMGSAAAWRLARRGQRVLGLDRFDPPHDRGSSHGRSRIIRQAYFEDPAYVPLVLRAMQLWRELERDAAVRLLTLTGGLMIGPPDAGVVAGARASAEANGLAHEVLTAAEVALRFPAFRLEDGEVALHEPTAGVLFPVACVQAQLTLAARHGAELRTGEPVVSWEADGGGVRVRTADRWVRAGRLVLAAGAWTTDLAGPALPTTVERQVVAWFRPRRPERFGGPRFPLFVAHHTGQVAAYGLPGLAGEGVKVGLHHGGQTGLPDRLPREVRPEEIAAIRSALRRRLPELDGEPAGAGTCLYTNSPDRHFLVGPPPGSPGVIVVGGFSGHGFKFCPVVGEIVADLVVDGTTAHDIDRFSPARPAVTAARTSAS
jgi:sarcosine oxidase